MRCHRLLGTQATEIRVVYAVPDPATQPSTHVAIALFVVRVRIGVAGVASVPRVGLGLRVHFGFTYSIKASFDLLRNSERQIAAVGDDLHIAAWIDNAIAGTTNVTA